MHQAEILLRAHLRDPKSTEASIGVIYGMLIAAQPRFVQGDWARIHSAIMKRFEPKSQDAWFRKLDRIKAHGWRLHEGVCALQAEA